MYFLLNDAVFNLNSEDLADSLIARRFGAIGFDFVQTLGKELFAEHPLVHRTHPERAIKLCALIHFKAPSVNAALFVAPSMNCRPRDVGVRFASLDIQLLAALQNRHAEGVLTPNVADREVWRRLAA
jgi:hypothetical protein